MMKSRAWTWTQRVVIGLGLIAISAGSALAHSYNRQNQKNRSHKAVWNSPTGNFRRGDIIKAMKIPDASVRPLARALGQSHANQKRLLDKVWSYQSKRGEVIQIVHQWRGGKVNFVAAPVDKSKRIRVMSDREVRRLGLMPQKDVIPALGALIKGQDGKVGKPLKASGVTYSGLSYQAHGERVLKKWPGRMQPREGYQPVLQNWVTVPITATKDNLRGSTVYQYTTRKAINQ